MMLLPLTLSVVYTLVVYLMALCRADTIHIQYCLELALKVRAHFIYYYLRWSFFDRILVGAQLKQGISVC